MKTFRLAFLLGILSTSLVGCNSGGNKCTVTFNGTNCFIRNGLDDKAQEFTTLKVDKNSSQTFQIFVKETDKYLVPDGSKVDTGDVKHEYYQSTDKAGHKEGQLVFPNIDHDVVITATARTKGEITYSVTYPEDTNATWSGPKQLKLGESLEATVEIKKEGYTLEKDSLLVFVGRNLYWDFGFENKTLTIPASAITDSIRIYGNAAKPSAEYTLEFAVENATKGKDFPEKMKEGAYLDVTFTANEGYRLPIQDGTPQCEEFQIRKTGGVYMPLVPFDFETFTGDYIYSINTGSDGSKYAEVIILPYSVMGGQFTSVSFIGKAIKQVSVTFNPVDKNNEGYWPDSDKSTEPKVGTIDIGKTLDDAAKACGANKIPEIDDPSKQFEAWIDTHGAPVYSTRIIKGDLTVRASFDVLEFKLYTTDVDTSKITITGWTEESTVKYHEALTGITFAINDEAKAQGYKLPDKEDVVVKMDDYQPENAWKPVNFNYTKDADGTSATFSIDAGIIEGDLKIEKLQATQYVSITFDPNGGTWPDKTTVAKTTPLLPATSTYQAAFDLLKTKEPTPESGKFSQWQYNGTNIPLSQKIDPDRTTLKAAYTEAITFQNDTWENVIKNATSKAKLIEAYGDTIYIGATKNIEYTDPETNVNKVYTVRLIAFEYDYYKKNNVNTLSAATFEFVDLIGEGIYGKIPDTTKGRNSWGDSVYRSYLNNFYSEICAGVPGFAAKSAIKHTLHGYVTDEEKAAGITPKDMLETEEKFFPLSGAEINIADDNGYNNKTTYQEAQRNNEALPDAAGQVYPYEYYKDNTDNRIKKLNGTVADYWLRSPHVYKEEKDTNYFDDDPDVANAYWMDLKSESSTKKGARTDFRGGNEGSSGCDYEKGYMAAFCI